MAKVQVNMELFGQAIKNEKFSAEAFFELVKISTGVVQCVRENKSFTDIFDVELTPSKLEIVDNAMDGMRALSDSQLTASVALLSRAKEIVIEEGLTEITREVAERLKDDMAKDPAMEPYIQEMERAA